MPSKFVNELRCFFGLATIVVSYFGGIINLMIPSFICVALGFIFVTLTCALSEELELMRKDELS